MIRTCKCTAVRNGRARWQAAVVDVVCTLQIQNGGLGQPRDHYRATKRLKKSQRGPDRPELRYRTDQVIQKYNIQ